MKTIVHISGLALAAICIGAIYLAGIPAQAAEVARLANGFSISCDHHAMVDGRVRLYTGADSYLDLKPSEIVDIAQVASPESTAEPTSPTPTPERKLSPEDLGEILSRASTSHNIDVDLLASVVKAESNGNAHAVSRAGARGLMQLMPGTAADLGVEDRDRPDENVRGGSAYLDSLLARYHDNLALALAAYNAGPAAVDRYHGIPPYRETRLYVARVIYEFNRRVRASQALRARVAHESAKR